MSESVTVLSTSTNGHDWGVASVHRDQAAAEEYLDGLGQRGEGDDGGAIVVEPDGGVTYWSTRTFEVIEPATAGLFTSALTYASQVEITGRVKAGEATQEDAAALLAEVVRMYRVLGEASNRRTKR